jgi:hypothetical protein
MEKVIAEFPIGTLLRIERLVMQYGAIEDSWVTVLLEDGQVVYLSHYFLAKNRFVWSGWSDSTEWDGEPELLEKLEGQWTA